MIDSGTALADVAFFRPVPALTAPYFDRPSMEATSLMLASAGCGASLAERDALLRTVQSLADLPEDWDGYGAAKIDPRTARNTKAAAVGLLSFVRIPEVTPNPNGTITLSWESGEGEAQLEIGATRFSFFLIPRVGAVARQDGDAARIDPGLGAFVSEYLYPRRDRVKTITRIELTSSHGRPFT